VTHQGKEKGTQPRGNSNYRIPQSTNLGEKERNENRRDTERTTEIEHRGAIADDSVRE